MKSGCFQLQQIKHQKQFDWLCSSSGIQVLDSDDVLCALFVDYVTECLIMQSLKPSY